MATENPMTMLESDSSINWRASASLASPSNATVGNDIFSNFMQGNGIIRETESTAPYRSGSAPPTFEGSIAALRDFMDQQSSSLTSSTSGELDCQSEEQLRSHPTYISYYYANVNLNPRLPPPLISRENQHLVRHIVGWGTGRRLPTLDQGFLYSHREEFEEDILAKQALDVQSRDSSTYMTGQKNVSSADHSGSPVQMQEGCPAPSICETTANDGNDKDDKAISVTGHSLVSDSCSASLSNADAPAPLPDDRNTDFDRDTSTQGTTALNTSKIELKLKALNVSGALETGHNQMRQSKLPGLPQQDIVNQVPGVQVQAISQGMNNSHDGMEKFSGFHPKFVGMHPYMHNPGLIPPLYATTAAVMASGNPVHPNAHPSSLYNAQLTLGGFGVGWHPTYPSGYPSHNGLSVPIEGYSGLGVIKHDLVVPAGESNPYVAHVQYLNKIYGQRGLMLHPSLGGPIQGQHFPHTFEEAYRVAAVQHSPPSERDGIQGKTNANVSETEPDATAFVGDKKLGYLANQSSNISFPGRSGRASVNYYVRPPGCSITQVPAPFTLMQGSPVVGINHSETVDQPSFSQASPRSTRMYSGLKGHRGSESSDDFKRHSFVELLKSSSARKLELSDIVGQIVQFSTDQHGSRFIQQKLEHCSAAEKESVFNEVLPHASKLTTDVFGNYVIQKFFQYGSPEQRRKLADQHAGQILTLSLQMYGCRVIQKALEVVELDQKIKLVQELDGHVMRCVHDQNGNHVIQKCIESVPAEKTGFIICAFHGQVSTLSSHPYGCRVIQRVLEHYSDQVTSQSVVAEILESACALAYDPYGNYVTQHVLEMGKPKERSKLMSKFSGGFVQMSQHKYASNVVEKCLKYSNTKERDLLIEEIIEQPETDDLLAMMKDQYANYVIQKILEICSDKQRERLFNCIRDDVQALKKYTYAKHIIARYEQLSEDKSEDMPATVREG